MAAVGKDVRVDHHATFDILVPGIIDGVEATGRFTITAWLVDKLAPKILLGTDLLDQNGVIISYPHRALTFQSCRDLRCGFELVNKANPVNRRLVAEQETRRNPEDHHTSAHSGASPVQVQETPESRHGERQSGLHVPRRSGRRKCLTLWRQVSSR